VAQMFKALAVSTVLHPLLAAQADAHCSFEKFDTTLPRAITGTVYGIDGNFVWASDLDRVDGRNWVWNYINNISKDRALNALWKKANIRIDFSLPLAPGSAYCNKYMVNKIEDNDIDDQAPILYGAQNTEQRASIFSEKKKEAAVDSRITSGIETVVLQPNGEAKELHVYVSYEVLDGAIEYFTIDAPSDVYVAIPIVDKVWTEKNNTMLATLAKNESSDAGFYMFSEFSAGWKAAPYYSGLGGIGYESGILVKGSLKGISLAGRVTGNIAAEIIVFDAERNPAAAGFVTIPVLE